MLNDFLPQVLPLLEKKNCASRIKPSIQQPVTGTFGISQIKCIQIRQRCVDYVNERYLEMLVQRHVADWGQEFSKHSINPLENTGVCLCVGLGESSAQLCAFAL